MKKKFIMVGVLALAGWFGAVPAGAWQFDRNEAWRADAGVELTREPAGMLTKIEKKPDWNKPPFQFNLREKASEKELGSPEKIEFELELLDGSGVTVALYLKDAAGEFFSYPQRPLKNGLNKISWDVRSGSDGHWGDNGNGEVDFPVRLEALILHQYPSQNAATLRFRKPGAEGRSRRLGTPALTLQFSWLNIHCILPAPYQIGLNFTP